MRHFSCFAVPAFLKKAFPSDLSAKVYYAIFLASDDEGFSTVHVETMSAIIGEEVKAVEKAVEELEKSGVLGGVEKNQEHGILRCLVARKSQVSESLLEAVAQLGGGTTENKKEKVSPHTPFQKKEGER